MALQHASPGVPVGVQPFGDGLRSQQTTALFKSKSLEVIRLVLLAGKHLPAHQIPGEMTLQCIEGQLTIKLGESRQSLAAGQMLFLQAQTMYELEAEQDSSALLTIALHGD